jgi:uncharacterized repeat protein (TIGR01451 family)
MKNHSASFAAVLCVCVTAVMASYSAALPAATANAAAQPTVASISPTKVAAGSAALTLTVNGTGFVSGTTAIQVGDVVEPTTFVSSTKVTAAINAEQLLSGALLPVIALNGDQTSGGGTAVNLEVDNPTPSIAQLVPAWLPTGSASTAVPVVGSGFTTATIIHVNGAARTTVYYSASQVDVIFTAADLATAGNLSVTAVNPSPGGGTSAKVSFVVGTPAVTPSIYAVYPSQLYLSSVNSSITVLVSSLTSSSVVQWNGTALVTSASGYGVFGYEYSYYITAVVPSKYLAKTGSASITVDTPTALPAVSNSITVTIVSPPAPTLTSIYPASGPIGTATSITLTGTGFTPSSVVSYNGTALATTYGSETSLTATLSAASVPLPGNGNIKVTTPAPGGGSSVAVAFTAYIGIANNSMVYNPANGLFYVSVPSSAGAPYGNSVVSVDPETGALGTPIPVGSEPDQLAISSDGTILWVGLDGASAVRQVNLKTGKAGLQFTLGGNGGIYETPATALALVALPGAPNSVVVSTVSDSDDPALAIYDSGVLRGTATGGYATATAYALAANGTKKEIYAGAGSTYNVYTYNNAGLKLKSTVSTGTYTGYTGSEMQIAGGKLYTDYGTVYDAESGALLGAFYNSGSTAATGPVTADTSLGRAFILDSTVQYSQTYNQIQIFEIAGYTSASSTAIPVNLNSSTSSTSHLTRWGINGLAFRTSLGVYSLRSKHVKDLSTVDADLGVTLAATGSDATGANTTYTATVTNAGPSSSTNIALTALIPATGVLVSATPSAGSCSAAEAVTCDLGGLAKGAKATVTFVVRQLTAGSAALTVQVSGSENDPNLANNQATATAKITGATYNLTPAITAISPAVIEAGSSATEIAVTGSGFASGTSILLNGSKLSTTVVSATELTATVPAKSLASLGWSTVTVSNPTPGGGVSNPLPLTVYSVITLGVNHIVYDPFSRKIMASVGSGSSSVTGNSIVAITPETGSIGTPVYVGSQPTKMAISDDGNILYSLLGGANSVARFNLQTQKTEFTFSPPFTNYGSSTTGFRDVAIQTGSENTIVVDFGYTSGMAIIDVNPKTKTAAIRGTGTEMYTGTSLHFYDPDTLYLFNSDTWQTLNRYSITENGFGSSYSSSTLLDFGLFQLSGKLGFANAGGVADVTTTPATQLGYYAPLVQYGASQLVAPDTSLGQIFFLGETSNSDQSYGNPDGIVVYKQSTFMLNATLPLNMAKIEGNTSFTGVDLIRWGQDGLAALSSGGHIYLLSGPVVAPELLKKNAAATLTSSSATTITHGTGNTLLTLTGTHFVPGVAVNWNGSYRTTTIVDATHLTVAIPASDLASAGSASLVAVNPGASASAALKVTIK